MSAAIERNSRSQRVKRTAMQPKFGRSGTTTTAATTSVSPIPNRSGHRGGAGGSKFGRSMTTAPPSSSSSANRRIGSTTTSGGSTMSSFVRSSTNHHASASSFRGGGGDDMHVEIDLNDGGGGINPYNLPRDSTRGGQQIPRDSTRSTRSGQQIPRDSTRSTRGGGQQIPRDSTRSVQQIPRDSTRSTRSQRIRKSPKSMDSTNLYGRSIPSVVVGGGGGGGYAMPNALRSQRSMDDNNPYGSSSITSVNNVPVALGMRRTRTTLDATSAHEPVKLRESKRTASADEAAGLSQVDLLSQDESSNSGSGSLTMKDMSTGSLGPPLGRSSTDPTTGVRRSAAEVNKMHSSTTFVSRLRQSVILGDLYSPHGNNSSMFSLGGGGGASHNNNFHNSIRSVGTSGSKRNSNSSNGKRYLHGSLDRMDSGMLPRKSELFDLADLDLSHGDLSEEHEDDDLKKKRNSSGWFGWLPRLFHNSSGDTTTTTTTAATVATQSEFETSTTIEEVSMEMELSERSLRKPSKENDAVQQFIQDRLDTFWSNIDVLTGGHGLKYNVDLDTDASGEVEEDERNNADTTRHSILSNIIDDIETRF